MAIVEATQEGINLIPLFFDRSGSRVINKRVLTLATCHHTVYAGIYRDISWGIHRNSRKKYCFGNKFSSIDLILCFTYYRVDLIFSSIKLIIKLFSNNLLCYYLSSCKISTSFNCYRFHDDIRHNTTINVQKVKYAWLDMTLKYQTYTSTNWLALLGDWDQACKCVYAIKMFAQRA